MEKVAVINEYGSGSLYEIDVEWETSDEVKEKGKWICDFDNNVAEGW
jgi:hypothetical protein